MENPRKYGQPPYNIVLVHGGPGAPGEMKPVAEELSKDHGVLEPLQTADSVDGQVEELKNVIETQAKVPIFLVGYSWGAWLAYLVAAKHPDLIKKLILVSSGPFEESYVKDMMLIRQGRLSPEEQQKIDRIMGVLNKNDNSEVDLQEFGKLMKKGDSFDPITETFQAGFEFQSEIYQKVWGEAAELRRSEELLAFAQEIRCPVVAIHGDYDPHPAQGVEKPLSKVLKDFKFNLLKNCGHTPWKEKQARDKFFETLDEEVI